MERWRLRSLLALSASAVYLYGFPSATITFGILVLFHVAVGILLTVLLLPVLFRLLQVDAPLARVGWIFLALGAVLGIALIFIGTLNRLKPWLYAHIALCVIGALFVATAWLASRGFMGSNAGSGSSDLQVWCSRQQRLPPEHGGRAKSPGEMPIES